MIGTQTIDVDILSSDVAGSSGKDFFPKSVCKARADESTNLGL
jgi:hypothetical protein